MSLRAERGNLRPQAATANCELTTENSLPAADHVIASEARQSPDCRRFPASHLTLPTWALLVRHGFTRTNTDFWLGTENWQLGTDLQPQRTPRAQSRRRTAHRTFCAAKRRAAAGGRNHKATRAETPRRGDRNPWGGACPTEALRTGNPLTAADYVIASAARQSPDSPQPGLRPEPRGVEKKMVERNMGRAEEGLLFFRIHFRFCHFPFCHPRFNSSSSAADHVIAAERGNLTGNWQLGTDNCLFDTDLHGSPTENRQLSTGNCF